MNLVNGNLKATSERKLIVFRGLFIIFRHLFSSTFTVGLCSFENGFCGLKHDNNMEHQWHLNSGNTPSTDTGPRYDHTTYSQKGIFS